MTSRCLVYITGKGFNVSAAVFLTYFFLPNGLELSCGKYTSVALQLEAE